PGYQPTIKPNPLQIIKLSEAIGSAKQPVILAGAGVLVAEAQDELREFAEKYDLPVVNTLHGLGGLPRSHRLSLEIGGIHGSYSHKMELYDSGLLINNGVRFDYRLTG